MTFLQHHARLFCCFLRWGFLTVTQASWDWTSFALTSLVLAGSAS